MLALASTPTPHKSCAMITAFGEICGLVRDAVVRVQGAARQIGAAAILAHAVNERAKDFYLSCGFIESPLDPLTLMARVKDVTAALETST